MPDGVDAAVDAVQATGCHPLSIDPGSARAPELAPGDHPC